jgi:3-oxoacyl-[acyl-carrier protein] reductase
MHFQQAGNAAYGAAKGGIIGLSQSLAKEFYADDIRVNCIGSGLLRKPLAEGSVKPVTGLARTGRPEDIAYAALYLASDEAGWVTGQVLNVDGGVDVGTRPLWQYERKT